MDMKIYGNMIFSKRHELDKLAYAKYYDPIPLDSPVMSFNQFYGTETHKKYLLLLLRKLKLEKIDEFGDKKKSQQS